MLFFWEIELQLMLFLSKMTLVGIYSIELLHWLHFYSERVCEVGSISCIYLYASHCRHRRREALCIVVCHPSV